MLDKPVHEPGTCPYCDRIWVYLVALLLHRRRLVVATQPVVVNIQIGVDAVASTGVSWLQQRGIPTS